MLFKEIVDARTHRRTDDGRRALKDHKSSLSTSCSGELKIICLQIPWQIENSYKQSTNKNNIIIMHFLFLLYTFQKWKYIYEVL